MSQFTRFVAFCLKCRDLRVFPGTKCLLPGTSNYSASLSLRKLCDGPETPTEHENLYVWPMDKPTSRGRFQRHKEYACGHWQQEGRTRQPRDASLTPVSSCPWAWFSFLCSRMGGGGYLNSFVMFRWPLRSIQSLGNLCENPRLVSILEKCLKIHD